MEYNIWLSLNSSVVFSVGAAHHVSGRAIAEEGILCLKNHSVWKMCDFIHKSHTQRSDVLVTGGFWDWQQENHIPHSTLPPGTASKKVFPTTLWSLFLLVCDVSLPLCIFFSHIHLTWIIWINIMTTRKAVLPAPWLPTQYFCLLQKGCSESVLRSLGSQESLVISPGGQDKGDRLPG
jgi:hypothetical protein